MTSYDIKAIRGDTFRRKIIVEDNAGPVDITDWIIYFTIKKEKSDRDGDAVIQKKITEHTAPTNGESLIEMTPAETKNLLGKYYYDIQFKKKDGDIRTPLGGTIRFTRDITQDDG